MDGRPYHAATDAKKNGNHHHYFLNSPPQLPRVEAMVTKGPQNPCLILETTLYGAFTHTRPPT